MATMKWTGQRHRGACSITEAPILRRKYAKPRRNTSPSAMDRARLAEHEAQDAAFRLFEAHCNCVVLTTLPIATLKTIHRACLPLAAARP